MSHQDPTEQAPVDTGHPLHDATDPNCQHCRLTREQRGLHVHTSQTGPGFIATCAGCQTLEAARRKGSDAAIMLQASDQPKRPEAWTVDDPYARTPHMFERPDLAMAYAASVSRSDRPTIVTDPDGVQVLVLRVDPRVTVQAVRNLTGPAPECSGPDCPTCRSLAEQPRPESSAQALAGARLFFALYHHPKIYPELIGENGPLSNTGFMKAYMSAQRAFLPDEYPSRKAEIYRDDDQMLIAQGRREGAQLPEGWYQRDGVQEPLADLELRCIQQGRREAAEAIRQQARMFGVEDRTEGEQGTMLSFNVAADLAEGRTGVQAGGQ